MPEPEQQAAERMERLAARMLAGRRAGIRPSDAVERETIFAALALTAAGEGHPRMSSRFRRRLLRQLSPAPASWLSRRHALTGGVGLAAGAVAGALGARGLELRTVAGGDEPLSSNRSTIEPSPASGRWVDSGLTLDDLAEGVPRRVNAGAVGVYLVMRNRQVKALSAFCTHLPCELRWQAAPGILLCPCHSRGFSLEGLSLDTHYPLPPLPQARVRVRGGRIEVLGT